MQQVTLAATAFATALSVSSAVNAATLYEKDGMKMTLKGDYQIQAYQKIGNDNDLDIDYDDLELKFGVSYELDNNMSAFGNLELDWKNQGDGSDDDIVDDAYVGLDFGNVKVSMGRQYWGSDSFYTERAIEMDGGIAFEEGDTGGNDTIQFEFGVANFNAVLSHDLEAGDGDESATDLYLTGEFAGAEVGLGYQTYDPNEEGVDSVDTVGVRGMFDAGPVNVGVDYSTNDIADYTNLSVKFPIVANTSGAIGATLIEPDQGDEVTQWYANATHKLHKNVSVFAEVGDNDAENTDMGYLAGMRVKF